MIVLRTTGRARNIEKSIVGRITRNGDCDEKAILIDEDQCTVGTSDRFLAIISTRELGANLDIPAIENIPNLSHLCEGDIIALHPNGTIHTLYRVNSLQNSLLVTERCNSNCLMCSQPPKDRPDEEGIFNIHRQLIPLIPRTCTELGITGGEPTLTGHIFFETLKLIKTHLPTTEIHVLTNGRSFAWHKMAEKLADLGNDRMMFGVPIYSDFYQSHDYVVQAKDAFYQTILGLHNLARYNQRVEIRVVLHKLSIPRLTKLAKFIYKNLPFAEHIAFMGLEHIGYTPYNMQKLWIDPSDYKSDLEEAVNYLTQKRMNVSIYNSQLCLLPENLWEHARKSISDWKSAYAPICKDCTKRENCGGFFAWNLKSPSRDIAPFNN